MNISKFKTPIYIHSHIAGFDYMNSGNDKAAIINQKCSTLYNQSIANVDQIAKELKNYTQPIRDIFDKIFTSEGSTEYQKIMDEMRNIKQIALDNPDDNVYNNNVKQLIDDIFFKDLINYDENMATDSDKNFLSFMITRMTEVVKQSGAENVSDLLGQQIAVNFIKFFSNPSTNKTYHKASKMVQSVSEGASTADMRKLIYSHAKKNALPKVFQKKFQQFWFNYASPTVQKKKKEVTKELLVFQKDWQKYVDSVGGLLGSTQGKFTFPELEDLNSKLNDLFYNAGSSSTLHKRLGFINEGIQQLFFYEQFFQQGFDVQINTTTNQGTSKTVSIVNSGAKFHGYTSDLTIKINNSINIGVSLKTNLERSGEDTFFNKTAGSFYQKKRKDGKISELDAGRIDNGRNAFKTHEKTVKSLIYKNYEYFLYFLANIKALSLYAAPRQYDIVFKTDENGVVTPTVPQSKPLTFSKTPSWYQDLRLNIGILSMLKSLLGAIFVINAEDFQLSNILSYGKDKGIPVILKVTNQHVWMDKILSNFVFIAKDKNELAKVMFPTINNMDFGQLFPSMNKDSLIDLFLNKKLVEREVEKDRYFIGNRIEEIYNATEGDMLSADVFGALASVTPKSLMSALSTGGSKKELVDYLTKPVQFYTNIKNFII